MDVFARPRRVEHVHDDAGRARHVRMLRESERKTEAREDRARGHGGGIKCARAMMDAGYREKEEEKDESVYVVTVPMTMMKSTLEKVKSGELKASGVLVEHPLAFIEDSRAVVAAEKEAAESALPCVPESDAKEDPRRVKIGETPVAFLGVNATKKVVWAAEENVKREKKMSSSKTIVGKDELLYASMNAAMDAAGKTKEDLEHANSITCLKEGSCLPIGGYSIATAFLDGFSRYLYNESAPSIFVTARLIKRHPCFATKREARTRCIRV